MTVCKKVVIVTGATSGIGDAVVQAFGATGASVILVGRDEERGQRVLEAIQKLGCATQLMLGDVAESGFADQVIAHAAKALRKGRCPGQQRRDHSARKRRRHFG